ncbi:MAG: T9SS type A sorting domain-containing protein [Thermofilaceae archaeon]
MDNLVVTHATTATQALSEKEDLGEGWDVLNEVEAEELQVINIPNPVRDVRTTTFVLFGIEAEAVRVEIYDLTGRLVWEAESSGNELVWHTEDLTGSPLANGVYIYVAFAKVSGTWIGLKPQKLVILR